MKKIALIDTGAANIHSVHKALKYVGASVEITDNSDFIQKADLIVFPGVGAFSAVMESINSKNLKEVIKEIIESGKPFLGICVGLQVLFEESEEHGRTKGLGILKGKVIKFRKAKKIPHIGWNDVTWNVIARSHEVGTKQSQSQFDLDCHASLCSARNDTMCQYYFVHSYYVVPSDKSIIYGKTEYDDEQFVSVVKRDNLIAIQFHPEKSGEVGLDFLKQFVETKV
ncbi:MAG: imidazole glycerol phosphate synthase subunit HisH [Candidatus Melainabacteria bacterium]|nr:imidazole glycerol phosphate synthase subunit HisH [Candidatus Melainabacteria bacterium]